MTPLRQRMIEDMQARNLAPHTQSAYLQHVSQFARHFRKSPELLGPTEIRAFQGSVWKLGVTPLSPGAGLRWGLPRRGDRIPRRAHHCKTHTSPAGAGQRLVETIASAGICSSAD